jgi:putative methyltransferase (TIGR04325 family)
MRESIKKKLKRVIPLSLRQYIASYRYGFFGPYQSWEEVKKKTSGYENTLIVEKVEQAIRKVLRGEAAYERDSVTFDTPEYSWFLLGTLLSIAHREQGVLRVVDFGGSLGSTYFQNRVFLKEVQELKWNIVEQENFVISGRKNFSSDDLHFYYSIEESLRVTPAQTIIFASSIQYVEDPYALLATLMREHAFTYLIFDRTTLTDNDEDMVVLQKVPPQVYDASYPCWFLSKQKLIDFLSSKYELVAEVDALGGVVRQRQVVGKYEGLFFKLKSS